MKNEISEKVEKTETETENVPGSDGSPNTEQPDQGSTPDTPSNPSETVDVEIFGELQAVVPIEIREHTPFVTEAGDINVIHEITLGDLLISTILMAILIFQVLTTFFRRY